MELATINVTPAEAEAKVREYEQVIAAERTVEDKALAQAYRAARRGLKMISLSRAIGDGGYFTNGLPKIAICPATATQCFVRWASWNDHELLFGDGDGWGRNRGALVGRDTVRVQPSARPAVVVNRQWQGTTVVPLVPPRYRPRRPRRLSRCHLLWEVERWDRTPPRDPALLRHIRGDLWAVLAEWDLTELERTVLAQR